MGMDVVPTLSSFSIGTTPGAKKPRPMPTPMAVKIHSVRYRSRKDSRFVNVLMVYRLPISAFRRRKARGSMQ